MRNLIVGSCKWGDVVAIGDALKNSPSCECVGEHTCSSPFRQSLVYLADNSMGGREWDADGTADLHHVPNEFIGEWHGFRQRGSRRFRWESATSGAIIEATRERRGWRISFCGATAERKEIESFYLVVFAKAVKKVTEATINRPEAIRQLEHENGEALLTGLLEKVV